MTDPSRSTRKACFRSKLPEDGANSQLPEKPNATMAWERGKPTKTPIRSRVDIARLRQPSCLLSDFRGFSIVSVLARIKP